MKGVIRLFLILVILATSGLFAVTLKNGTVLFAGNLEMLIGAGFILLYLKNNEKEE